MVDHQQTTPTVERRVTYWGWAHRNGEWMSTEVDTTAILDEVAAMSTTERLRQLPDQRHLPRHRPHGEDPPQPPVGPPGASALAEYHRRRHLELAPWRHDLAGRVVLVACVFIVSWFAGWLLTGPLPNGLLWAPATAGALWLSRFRVSADAPRRGRKAPQVSARPRKRCARCSAAAGWCCTTWPSAAAARTSTIC
ncbi:MAG: hypothetical protein ACRDZO_15730 [Egibacteraceae bacterium]